MRTVLDILRDQSGKGGGGIPGSPMDKEQAKKLRSVEKDIGAPTRKLVAPQALEALTTNNAFQTSLPASARQGIEGQFAQAKNDIMAGAGGRGGMLRNALVNNANTRAGTIAKATDDYRQMGIQRAMDTLVPAAIPDAKTQAGQASSIANNQMQRNMAQAQSDAQGQQSMMGGLGAIASLIPLMFSTREAKENIQPVDVYKFLDDIVSMPIYTWNYKGDTGRTHIGPVVEESPTYIVEGKYLNAQDCIGFLLGAVKALTEKVRSLEGR